jgi:hypothetical protein
MIKPTNDFTYAATLLGALAVLSIAPATAFAEYKDGSAVAVTVPPVMSGAALSEPTGPPTRGRPAFKRAPLLIGIP